MSADNGVYILTVGEDFGKPEKFCVFHATNIEELYSEKEQWRRDYFDRNIKNAPSFLDRDKALLYAGKIARNTPVLEYGISFLSAMRFPEEWWIAEICPEGEDDEEDKRLPPLLEAARLVAEGMAVEVGTTPLRMKMLRKALKAYDGDKEAE